MLIIANRQIDKLIVKNTDDYRSSIRSSVRGAWTGTYDYVDFLDAMFIAIDRGFTQAWDEGMSEYGMSLADATFEERARLQGEILNERQYVSGYADYIAGNAKGKNKLATVMQRGELWANAYDRIRQLAKMYAARDEPQKWQMNMAEHCSSCIVLNGKVKRASYWKEHITPRSWGLKCHSNCHCELIPTSEPLSRGALPGGF